MFQKLYIKCIALTYMIQKLQDYIKWIPKRKFQCKEDYTIDNGTIKN